MAITTPSGARPRGAARRDALLDAVLSIVAEVGTDAVTHRRVAEVAGLPLASTTYWFESKEHLLTAALERAAERDIERLNEFLGDPTGAAEDPLTLAIDVILGPLEERDQCNRGSLLAIYALMLEAARRPALRAINQRWTDAYLDVLVRLLELAGYEVVDLPDIANCCGFGGSFSFEWPQVAGRLAQWKLDAIAKTGCAVVASDNPGCLVHIAAAARRRGVGLRVAHVLELVAEHLA